MGEPGSLQSMESQIDVTDVYTDVYTHMHTPQLRAAEQPWGLGGFRTSPQTLHVFRNLCSMSHTLRNYSKAPWFTVMNHGSVSI